MLHSSPIFFYWDRLLSTRFFLRFKKEWKTCKSHGVFFFSTVWSEERMKKKFNSFLSLFLTIQTCTVSVLCSFCHAFPVFFSVTRDSFILLPLPFIVTLSLLFLLCFFFYTTCNLKILRTTHLSEGRPRMGMSPFLHTHNRSFFILHCHNTI